MTDIKPHMKKDETELFLSCLKNSHVYFEFGVGGSTVLAAEQGLEIYGVDNDFAWVEKVSALAPRAKINFVNMGPLKVWGYPVTRMPSPMWTIYSGSIRRVSSPEKIDLVLVDGRFRVACFIQTLLAVKPGTKILIHDYERAQYRVVEDWAIKITQVRSLALFEKRELASHEIANMTLQYKAKYWKQVK